MSTPRRKRNEDGLLLALANGSSVPAAAKQCGLSDRSVYRRLRDPEFQQRLNAVRADLVKRAAGSLSAAGQKAVSTLLDLMKPAVSPAVRLGAAKAVLEIGVKLREVVEWEGRMTEMEAKMGHFERSGPHTSTGESHEPKD
jgi:hypothetical protein